MYKRLRQSRQFIVLGTEPRTVGVSRAKLEDTERCLWSLTGFETISQEKQETLEGFKYKLAWSTRGLFVVGSVPNVLVEKWSTGALLLSHLS